MQGFLWWAFGVPLLWLCSLPGLGTVCRRWSPCGNFLCTLPIHHHGRHEMRGRNDRLMAHWYNDRPGPPLGGTESRA